jgi:hypothetical protein
MISIVMIAWLIGTGWWEQNDTPRGCHHVLCDHRTQHHLYHLLFIERSQTMNKEPKEWSVEWLQKIAYEHNLTICFVPIHEYKQKKED